MIVLNKGTYVLNNLDLSDWGNSGTWTTQSLAYTCNGLECTELRIKSVNTNGIDGYKLQGYWTVNGGGYFTIYNSVVNQFYYTYIVITTDQEVDDSFHTWFVTYTTRMEDTPSVVGKWKFDAEPHIDQFENSSYNVKFISDGITFDQIEFYGNQQITEVDYGIVYNSTSNGSNHAYVANQDNGTSGWGLNQDIINIVEDPDDEQFKARLRDTANRLMEATKLTRLFPGPVVAKSTTRQLRKLVTEKPQEDSIIGTWVFNEELIKSEVQVSDASDVYFDCDYYLDYNDTQVTLNKIRLYGYYGDKLLQLFYCKDDEELQVYAYANLNTPTWDWSGVGIDKIIHITREPTDENFKTWLRANATKIA